MSFDDVNIVVRRGRDFRAALACKIQLGGFATSLVHFKLLIYGGK